MRAYVNVGLSDYLSRRFHSKQLTRVAVVPFDVPESFAPPGAESLHFGRQLARQLRLELLGREEFGIVELFNRDRWPGKREDFFQGNYQAIELSRNAGYDLVVVGYMEEIKNEEDLVIFTKIIDVSNNVTLWHARNTVSSKDRQLRRDLSRLNIVQDRPELFGFEQRTEEFARCTANAMFAEE